MGTMNGKFADQDAYVQNQQALTADNNQAELNAALAENDFLRASSVSFAQQALTRSVGTPSPNVSAATSTTIGAALAGIDQPTFEGGGGGGSGDDDGPCFASGTLVTMADETFKPIKDIVVGVDYVKAPNWSGERIDALVIGKFEHWVKESLIVIFADGRSTHTNAIHKYWVTGNIYEAISKLDWVWHWNGEWKRRDIVEKIPVAEDRILYNLTVQTIHTYEANGDAVSNLKPLE